MEAEKLFGTRNLYEILQVKTDAEIQDSKIFCFCYGLPFIELNHFFFIAVKKGFYRLARIYHPDRVMNDKEEAKAKFNVIHSAYSILSDSAKKEMYDNGSNVVFTKATIAARWENFLTEVKATDIEEARKRYQGSETEKSDIIREFVNGNGSITYLFNNLPFMRFEDENRVIEIVRELMDSGKIKKIQIKKMRK